MKDREPEKAFLRRGTAIHKALEVYLTTGEVIPKMEIVLPDGTKETINTLEYVQVAIPHIPKPTTDEYWQGFPKDDAGRPTAMLLLEQPGEMLTWEDENDAGPSVTQYIDCVKALPDEGTVIDFKTTSDFRYSKTPAELKENSQLNWNARYIFQISDYPKLEIGHLYLLTKNSRPKAKPVFVTVTRADVDAVWERDMETVKEMVAWAKLSPPTAEALPPNTDSCDMYGGCYYRTKCGFDVATVGWKKKVEPMPEAQQNTLLADLMRTAQQNMPAASVAKAAEAAAATPPASSLVALLGGGSAAAAPPPAPPAPPPAAAAPPPAPPAPPAEVAPPAPPVTSAAPAIGIVPPDAPPATSTPEEVEVANAAIAAKEAEAAAKAAAEEAGGAEAGGDVPKKRGRKPKNAAGTGGAEPQLTNGIGHASPEDVAAAVASSPFETTKEDAPQPPPAPAASPGEAPASVVNNVEQLRTILMTPDPTFQCGAEVIFVDCLPSKGWSGEQPTDLGTVMHAFERLAGQSAQKPDYRFIPYEAKGYLAQSIRVLMKGLPKAVHLDSRLPGADVFLSVVTPYAKMIFRGTR